MQKKKENIQNSYFDSLSMKELIDIQGGKINGFNLLKQYLFDLFTPTN